jgi:hypothetical protein
MVVVIPISPARARPSSRGVLLTRRDESPIANAVPETTETAAKKSDRNDFSSEFEQVKGEESKCNGDKWFTRTSHKYSSSANMG